MAAVASATPSTMPITTMDAPRTVAMSTGSRLWISSDEMSMNIEPSPNAQMPAGNARNAAGAAGEDGRLSEEGGFMREVISGRRIRSRALDRLPCGTRRPPRCSPADPDRDGAHRRTPRARGWGPWRFGSPILPGRDRRQGRSGYRAVNARRRKQATSRGAGRVVGPSRCLSAIALHAAAASVAHSHPRVTAGHGARLSGRRAEPVRI